MAGVWKKTLNYLGLVEDDEEFVDDMPRGRAGAGPTHEAPQAVRDVSLGDRGEVVRTIASPRVATASSVIHKSEPGGSTRRARWPTVSRTASP